MGILIHNITGDGVPDDAPHDYVLRINDRVICRFQHVRSEGLAECLRRAADAVDAKGEGKAAYERARVVSDAFDPVVQSKEQ